MFTTKIFWRGILMTGILLTFWFSQQAVAQELNASILAVTNDDPVIGKHLRSVGTPSMKFILW